MPEKRLTVAAGRYIAIPHAARPSRIPVSDWEAIGQINDYIIDRVHYDDERARSGRTDGVQTPAATLTRRRGVCMDYAALFEHLARARGYRVMSVTSDALDHAWNVVELADAWWIVDVTWNGGGSLAGGGDLPASVRADHDFRRRYLLTTLDDERDRARSGLLPSTHDAADTRLVDFERTIEAMGVLREMRSANTRRRAIAIAHNGVAREHNRLVGEFNATLEARHGELPGGQRRLVEARVGVLEERLSTARSSLDRYSRELDACDEQIGTLRARFAALEARHPLGVRLVDGDAPTDVG